MSIGQKTRRVPRDLRQLEGKSNPVRQFYRTLYTKQTGTFKNFLVTRTPQRESERSASAPQCVWVVTWLFLPHSGFYIEGVSPFAVINGASSMHPCGSNRPASWLSQVTERLPQNGAGPTFHSGTRTNFSPTWMLS